MKNTRTLLLLISVMLSVTVIFSSCKKNEADEIPTKTMMEGIWVVTEAYDSAGVSIMDRVQNHLIPVTAFWLQSDNTVLSTAGPFTTYLVYGDSKWTQVSSTIDQIFNYAALNFNNGEFFVADGSTDRFTIELKLEGIGGSSTLSDILEIFNIEAQWLKEVVYHKFVGVEVDFDDGGKTMTWTWDDQTTARYNMKDMNGDYVLWGGWPINKFSKCKLVLEKKTKSLNDITTEAYANPPTKLQVKKD